MRSIPSINFLRRTDWIIREPSRISIDMICILHMALGLKNSSKKGQRSMEIILPLKGSKEWMWDSVTFGNSETEIAPMRADCQLCAWTKVGRSIDVERRMGCSYHAFAFASHVARHQSIVYHPITCQLSSVDRPLFFADKMDIPSTSALSFPSNFQTECTHPNSRALWKNTQRDFNRFFTGLYRYLWAWPL